MTSISPWIYCPKNSRSVLPLRFAALPCLGSSHTIQIGLILPCVLNPLLSMIWMEH